MWTLKCPYNGIPVTNWGERKAAEDSNPFDHPFMDSRKGNKIA